MRGPNLGYEARLATLLATVAGFADVVGYVTLHHVFTAHMTGNASRLGLALGHGRLAPALPLVVLPASFVGGAVLGTVYFDAGARWALLATEAMLVAAYMSFGHAVEHDSGLVHHVGGPFYGLIAIAAAALGLQAAALNKFSGVTLRTSYVTGVLTTLAQGVVRRLGHREDDTPLLLLTGIWLAYVVGATVGAVSQAHLGWWSLALPTGALAAAAAVDGRRMLEADA